MHINVLNPYNLKNWFSKPSSINIRISMKWRHPPLRPKCKHYLNRPQTMSQLEQKHGCFIAQTDSLTREIIQSNIYRILPKFNQAIYYFLLVHNLCAKYHDPSLRGSRDIMFTRSIIVKSKREIIQSNIYRVLQRVNQVISYWIQSVGQISWSWLKVSRYFDHKALKSWKGG